MRAVNDAVAVNDFIKSFVAQLSEQVDLTDLNMSLLPRPPIREYPQSRPGETKYFAHSNLILQFFSPFLVSRTDSPRFFYKYSESVFRALFCRFLALCFEGYL